MNLKLLIDRIIGYAASATVILGAIHTELGGDHKVAIASAAAIAFIHHVVPVLQDIASKIPTQPAASTPPATKS
jgi:hypothetical protein